MTAARSLPTILSAAALTALTLLAGCGGGQNGATASSAGSGSPSAAARTYFGQYGTSTHSYKPRRLNPSVDGSLYVRGMRWRVWNTRMAVGQGEAYVNDCVPDCADGTYSRHAVTVYLSRPRELCGSRYFTALRMAGPDYRSRARWSGIGCR